MSAFNAIPPLTEGFVGWPAHEAERYRRNGWWSSTTLHAAIAECCSERPDQIAVIDPHGTDTYRELSSRAAALARHLASNGVRTGDRVIVQLVASRTFAVVLLACLRSGIVPVMALPAHRRHELRSLAEQVDAVALFVPAVEREFDHRSLADELCADVATLRNVYVDGPPNSGQHDLGRACAGTADDGPWVDDPSQIALFLLSGGTTGVPKLIARTHDDYLYNARTSADVSGFDGNSTMLVCLPAGHNFPLACPGLLGALVTGGRAVMAPSPEPQAAFAAIATHDVTHASVVPAVAASWLDHAKAYGNEQLRSLRVLQVGGARLASHHATAIEPVLGARLQQVFGMAEGLLNYTRLDDDTEIICTTQGRPISPGDELRIVGDEGLDLPAGELGELLTRGPYTIRGYYRADQQNRTSFTSDGWYRTGDVCRVTPDGSLVVEGRIKDLVNRGGEKISAEEIEGLILTHPDVARVAVVGVADDRLGERVCAVVVARPGAAIGLGEIRSWISERGVARFKLPEVLHLVESLPMTNVGKIDKKALRIAVEALA